MVKYCVNAVSLFILMWGLIPKVRLQIAQEFHILVDRGDFVLNMNKILIKGEELRRGKISFFLHG